MHVNVSDLKNEIFVLNDLIKKYEESVINMYYILEKSFEYWKDSFSSYYYDDLCAKKKYSFELIDDIKFIIKIYKYLEEKYSKIGNVIDIDLGKKDDLLDLFNDYIVDLSKLSNNYSNLNLSFGPGEYYDIISQKNNIINSKNKLEGIKVEYIHFYNNIDKIENNVFLKVSKYNINIIKINQNDYINQYKANSSISSVYIGKENLKSIIESANIYVKDQELLISKFRMVYDVIINCYISNNSKRLNLLYLQVTENMDSIVRYYIGFIDTLNYVISLKDKVVEKYESAFKKIGESDINIDNNNLLYKGDNFD